LSYVEQKPSDLTPIPRLVGGLVVAQICSLLGSAAFATTLARLANAWHLDSSQAGWISSAYFLGYALGVPLLVALTDHIDPLVVYSVGCGVGALAGIGFALFAHGMWSAFIFQALAGLATGGTYMPGLRLLTTRLKGTARIRAIPYFTTAYSIGTSVSFLLCGWLAERNGWRAAFLAGAAGAIISAILAVFSIRGIPVEQEMSVAPQRHPLDFRPVLRNRRALAYVLAYGGHCWELFAFRSWLPTYLLCVWHHLRVGNAGVTVSRWSMLIILIGVPASIFGAEAVHGRDRNRLMRRFQFASIVTCVLSVVAANFSYPFALLALFLYNIAIMADSGALTAGTVAVARPDQQGATLAVYSFVGFIGAAVGPLLAGKALDLGGGFKTLHAWYFGFITMGLGSALAAMAISRAETTELAETTTTDTRNSFAAENTPE
jgi:MFS family permease